EELQALFWPAYAETALAEIPDAVLARIADHLAAWTLRPASTGSPASQRTPARGGADTFRHRFWQPRSFIAAAG
ncbi:MAG: hypothetical protein ACLGII_06130, partial [Gammaproteobacteria bacterium]